MKAKLMMQGKRFFQKNWREVSFLIGTYKKAYIIFCLRRNKSLLIKVVMMILSMDYVQMRNA